IHDPVGWQDGSAEDMRKTADLLDQVKSVIVDTYVKRTGKVESTIAEMMAAETWMTATEAYQHGFADVITDEQRIAASYNFDWTKFKHAPQALTGGARPRRDMAEVRLVAQSNRIAKLGG
ncbi:MAG: hypothetical protein EHM77_07280, partial [Planctomycetaceae bacterium]